MNTPLEERGIALLKRFEISEAELEWLESISELDYEDLILWQIAQADKVRNHTADLESLITELLAYEKTHRRDARRSLATDFLREVVSEYLWENDPNKVPYDPLPF